MDWSFQLYSARNFQPWARVLETLGRLGYCQVEGFDGVYDNPALIRDELDRNGLSMPSGHFAIEALEQDFDGVERTAEALGIQLLVCPWLDAEARPVDATGWRAFGKRLAAIGKKAEGVGLEFAWHNHDFEFRPLADGSLPQDHLLEAAPDVGWEMDVAWIIRAGADPLSWIERHGRRIAAAHLKDIAPEGQAGNEDGWADVGHGTLDWRTLLAALRNRSRARYFVMEHDNPSDVERFARRSIEAVEQL